MRSLREEDSSTGHQDRMCKLMYKPKGEEDYNEDRKRKELNEMKKQMTIIWLINEENLRRRLQYSGPR